MYNNIYVLNADDAFVSGAKKASRTGMSVKSLFIEHAAFFCPRDTHLPIMLFFDGKQVPFSGEDFVIIRRWKPNGPATALLAMILMEMSVPISDRIMNISHSIRSSKLSHCFRLHSIGISSPTTWVFPYSAFHLYWEQMVESLGVPLIVKILGAKGKNVWKCTSKKNLKERVESIAKEKGGKTLLLFQEYIENESDIRVMVCKRKVLVAIERTSIDGFYNNLSQGASAQSVVLSEQERRIAIEATEHVGLDIAGVDIVRSAHEPLVFEVNKAPNLTSFNAAAGFDMNEMVVRQLLTTS